MTSGQDVSEYLDILGLVKSYFSSFFGEKNKKIKIFFLWCSADAPEDEAICLFAGLLANPDVPLSLGKVFVRARAHGKIVPNVTRDFRNNQFESLSIRVVLPNNVTLTMAMMCPTKVDT
jgi:hypothetical protein